MDTGMWIALSIFVLTFIFILAEKIDRTVVAISGAVVMVMAGTAFHFYDYKSALLMIEMDTIILLFGMMTLLGMLEKTGAFQFLAIKVAKLSKGEPVRLLLYLGLTTSLLSMFLDNITTVVLIAPVTLLIARLMGLSPAPYLISEAILSNIGGIATLVGDPPNLLIASSVSEFTFISFMAHLAPFAVVTWLIAFFIIKIQFKKELSVKPEGLKELMHMDPMNSLIDKKNALKLAYVFCGVVILFFLAEFIHLKTSVVVMLGLAVGFILTKSKVEEALLKVEWSILVFFAGLFITVGGLEHSGLLSLMSGAIKDLAIHNMLLCCIAVLWVGAAASALVDNIPFTIAVIPILLSLGQELGDPSLVYPLWWALALGVGLGGNATNIGATVNIVVVKLSEKTDTPITSAMWLKNGGMITFVSLIASSIMFFFMFAHMSSK